MFGSWIVVTSGTHLKKKNTFSWCPQPPSLLILGPPKLVYTSYMCGCTCFWNTCWILKQAKVPVRIRPSGLFLRFGVSNLCFCLWSQWLREDVWNMIERCRVGVLVQNVSSSKKGSRKLGYNLWPSVCSMRVWVVEFFWVDEFMMCLPHICFSLGIWHSEMTMHAFSQVPKPHGILNGSAKYNGDVSTLLGGWSCFGPNISKGKSTLHLCNYGMLLDSS